MRNKNKSVTLAHGTGTRKTGPQTTSPSLVSLPFEKQGEAGGMSPFASPPPPCPHGKKNRLVVSFSGTKRQFRLWLIALRRQN